MSLTNLLATLKLVGDQWTNGPTDQRTNGPTDQQTDRQTLSGIELLSLLKSKKIRALQTVLNGLEHRINQYISNLNAIEIKAIIK